MSQRAPDAYRQFVVNTRDGRDKDAYFVGLGAPGDDLRVRLSRTGGKFAVAVENRTTGATGTLATRHPEFLDGRADLVVGVFACDPRGADHTAVRFRAFTATVWAAPLSAAATRSPNPGESRPPRDGVGCTPPHAPAGRPMTRPTDGLLKYPVYEGWGNHDGPPVGKEKFGFSVQAKIKERTVARKKAGRIGNVSENGLHYSWDWDKVHFVQTNLYPADTQHAKVRYSLPWHDPQGALAFVKDDLKASVGDSGRPVIIVSHCGVDTDWWHPEDWAAFYAAVKPYNVIAYFYGHTGTGPRRYKPEGEDRVLDCVNTGQSEKGSVVAEVTEKRLRLAFHAKKDAKAEQVEWEWKYPLDKPVTAGK